MDASHTRLSADLARAAAEAMPTPSRGPAVDLATAAKPARILLDAAHRPLAAPELVHSPEATVSALQETIYEYANALRTRAQGGNITHRDGQLVASLSSAAAKLSQEQREQAAKTSLSLQSDEDIVTLVVDAVSALGPRGLAILTKALETLNTRKPT